MADIAFHWFDARGALNDLRDMVEPYLREGHRRAAERLALGPLDVAIMAGSHVVPEKGHVGHAPGPGRIFVTLDPGHPALRANPDASLERMFTHELHHAARWDGPGYGATLGEALVSEGLAGMFAHEVWGPPYEPWESLPEAEVRLHVAKAARDWDRRDYDHAACFFGTGTLPRWLGYSLGVRLVGRRLAREPSHSAAGLAQAPAAAFRYDL